MTPDPCAQCGEVHGRCKAHSKQSGGPCKSGEVEPGGVVCKRHGGATKQAKQAAAKRETARLVTELYDADANAVIAAMGVEPVTDPTEMLARLASEAMHMKDALGSRVNALLDITTTSKLGVEAIKAEVILYERAVDRTMRILDLLQKAGFMDRAIKVQEGTAEAVVAVLRRVFDRLALSPEQTALVSVVVPEELRALEE